MTLLICVDDGMGMAFGGRPQSRDKAVYADMAAFAAGQPMAAEPRAQKRFDGLGVTFSDTAPLRFLELSPPSAYDADTIVLYRWNRRYPADLYFDIDLTTWHLTESRDFPGNSHETITREVYIHGK